MLKEVSDQLLARETPRPPFAGPVPAEKESHWVKPELVAKVRYKEATGDGLLRQPAVLRFPADKEPEECRMPGAGSGERDLAEPTVSPPPSPRLPREVKFSNLD